MPAVCNAGVDNGIVAIDLVTGAFGFTGSRIASRVIADGRSVRTLSRRQPPPGHPLTQRVPSEPPAFDDPLALRRQLDGVERLFITYWMRYPGGGANWPALVGNVGRLAEAARDAGVRRIVYISVSNAAADASTAYFRAKAAAEELVRAAGVSHAIVRPTLLYGEGDILLNNMAWTLRRLPLFGIPGDGKYRVQPVHVDDVAQLCVRLAGSDDIVETDAAGPELFTFDELVATVRDAVGSRARLIHLPTSLVLATTRVIGWLVRDVVLTRDEIRELSESLLVSRAAPPLDKLPTRLTDWLATNAQAIGRRWSSELERNFRIVPARAETVR